MSDFKIDLVWQRETSDFVYDTYDRNHWVKFAGGAKLQCSSAPEYKGDATKANPEELLAAALSSCHMLTFLAIAAKKGFIVDNYQDDASAKMAKNAAGRMAIVEAVLHPHVSFKDKQPTSEELAQMHKKAHEACFIANSVNFPVTLR